MTMGGPTVSKHADPLELANETISDLRGMLAEVRQDLGWRATRYAMDGDFASHDVMTEALGAVQFIFLPAEFSPADPLPACNCRERYASKIGDPR